MTSSLEKTATEMLRAGTEVTTAATWLAGYLSRSENKELLLEAGLLLAREEHRSILVRLLVGYLKSVRSVEAVS